MYIIRNSHREICRRTLSALIGVCVCLRPALQAVMGNLKEEIENALLPIIHYGLDLWTCTRSGRKFLDVHVFYVDGKFVLRHALLAVSHDLNFVPSLLAPCQFAKLMFGGGMALPIRDCNTGTFCFYFHFVLPSDNCRYINIMILT